MELGRHLRYFQLSGVPATWGQSSDREMDATAVSESTLRKNDKVI